MTIEVADEEWLAELVYGASKNGIHSGATRSLRNALDDILNERDYSVIDTFFRTADFDRISTTIAAYLLTVTWSERFSFRSRSEFIGKMAKASSRRIGSGHTKALLAKAR